MRRQGDRVTITASRFADQPGTTESNVHQRTVDYLNEWANGYHVMLDTGELATVRRDQEEALR